MRRNSLFFYAILCIFGFGVAGFFLCTDHVAHAQNSTVIELTVLNPVSTTTYYISVSKNGTGSGTVTSSDGNIICGLTCFESNIPNASSTILTATADSNSTFTGWNVAGNPTICLGIGNCVVATTSVITATFTLNPVTPPTSGPVITTAPAVYPSGPSVFLFENFSSETTISSANISWYTTVPSISNIGWGVGQDATDGSGSEISYSNVHSIELDNLAPDTNYILTIQARSQTGQSIYKSYSFRTLPITNSIPLNVSNLSGQVSFGGNILLTWQNPFEPDFSFVTVTRGTRFFPRDVNEGYLVYQGPDEEVLDTNAVSGQQYYYSVFVTNTEGIHSSGSVLKYGLPFVSGTPATTTPLFGGTIITQSSTTETLITLPKIKFIQDNEAIQEINSEVSARASSPLLIEVPVQFVPRDTEEAIITVGKGTFARQTFIFKKLDDGSFQAFIPAVLPTGSTPFTISFLREGSEIHLNGDIVALGTPAPFVPQNMWSYVIETYISNNFLCTTLPIILMFFEAIVGLTTLVVLVNFLSKK